MTINPYHSSHNNPYTYFGTAPYIGFELELDTSIPKEQFHKSIIDACQSVDNIDHYFLEEDSSLANGVEFITQPHGLEAMEQFLTTTCSKLFSLFDLAGAEKNRCNAKIHFHFDRLWFGGTTEEQNLTIAKILMYYSKNEKQMLTFGNCTEETANKSRIYHFPDIDGALKYIETFKEPMHKRCRYTAVNVMTNNNTIEFRLFQSTTDVDKILEYMHWLVDLIMWAKNN